jgi:hypothetical protein
MKKVLTLSILALSFATMQAQKSYKQAMASSSQSSEYKPSKGTVTTEVGFNGGIISGFELKNTTTVAQPALKFRYFLKDNLALRLGFSATRDVTKSTPNITVTNTPGPSPAPSTTSVTSFGSSTFFGINLGAEKHFEGSERLSTYVGADLLIGSTRNFQEVTASPSGDFQSAKNVNTGGKEANFSIGLGLVTGADYYIAKKLYLGVELGLAMVSKKKKDTVETTKAGPNTVETTISDSDSDFKLNTQLNGGIRIGYQF